MRKNPKFDYFHAAFTCLEIGKLMILLHDGCTTMPRARGNSILFNVIREAYTGSGYGRFWVNTACLTLSTTNAEITSWQTGTSKRMRQLLLAVIESNIVTADARL
jgi:hypothetical protein